jgi:hypothetical protein
MRCSRLSRALAVLCLNALVAIPGISAAQSGPNPSANVSAAPALPEAPDSLPAHVSGTVTDTNGDVIPGATVDLQTVNSEQRQTQTSNDNGFFSFDHVAPGASYEVAVRAEGFESWSSPVINPATGQFIDLTQIKLGLVTSASVTVFASTEQIATQQVQVAEQQRVLGIIPNFYVVYDSANAVPLTTKLKFQMAYRVAVDPVSIIGAGTLAGINQAADRPDYQQGAKGYGQRFGAAYADGVSDILFGGAILPSLLHQDPRYFYQGTGTVKSRLMHALSNPFICRGDNGHLQPNYSSIGGDLISSALSNAYYPESNRGVGFTFQNVAVTTAERTLSGVLQEFVIRKLTPSANRHNSGQADLAAH